MELSCFTPIVLHSKITDSYHILLNINFNYIIQKKKANCDKIRYEHLTNFESLKTALLEENWSKLDDLDINAASNVWLKLLWKKASSSIKVKINDLSKRKPWITNGLVNAIRARDQLFKNVKHNPNTIGLKDEYIRFRNKLNSIVRQANLYYKNKIHTASIETKKLWNVTNEILNTNKLVTITKVIDEKGILVNMDIQIANTFNNFFIPTAEKVMNVGNSSLPRTSGSKPGSTILLYRAY